MTTSARPPRITRRQFIPGATGLLAALGIGGAGGYELRGGSKQAPASEPEGFTATTVPAAGNPGSGVSSFVTRPDLRPADVRITELKAHGEKAEPRFIVMAPMADIPYKSDQRGPMIVDRRGRLVWFERSDESIFDVQVQRYKGQRVLTHWQGELIGGYGIGVGKILDETYTSVATVGTDKLPLDLHEFNLTERGTALATHYETRPADLSSIGGAKNGVLLVGHALEIDIATGKVLLDWVSSDHVGLDESYQPRPSAAGDAYDFFHINSISVAHDGNLLISGRNTWTIYKVNRSTGEVMWRLAGKRSDFELATGTGFSWQHHVRAHGMAELTLMDNANISGHGSLALLLDVDEGAKKVTLKRAFQHPAKFVAWTLGSVEVRPDGNVFVGWGAQPYFSEFSADGELLVDGQFNSETRSYRTFLADWNGRPTGKPAMVARSNQGSGFVIYASWNGATDIDHWTVDAGSDATFLEPVGSQPWTGFETTIVVNSDGPTFQVAAIDSHGNELGRSDVT